MNTPASIARKLITVSFLQNRPAYLFDAGFVGAVVAESLRVVDLPRFGIYGWIGVELPAARFACSA